jgi:NADH:ubiquinone reductase (H+-translocating)
MSSHRVVVIGSGFGGLTATKALKHAPVDVTMIARTQHHLFQPLLYQVATGIVSEGEIAPATRRILGNQRNATVLLGDVVEINLAEHFVVAELLGQRYESEYDSLIVAAGAGQSYFGNDHFAKFAPGMKTIDDALELRGRILGAFELAEATSDPALREKLLTFTVIGAGPTGVELAGQIAELAAQTLKTAFRRIDSTHARVILLDAGTAVLTPMATVSRFSAVAKVGPLELGGFTAWVAWLLLHLVYLVGFRSKMSTVISWTATFLTMSRGQLTITERQTLAQRPAEQPTQPDSAAVAA